MRELLARLKDWFRRDRLDRELQDELAFHQRQLERDGRTGPEARRQLGNVTQVREAARDRWSIPWLDHFQQDVRYAIRGLRRSPGFALGVIITLGLGIGANAAMFGIIDQLMFRPHAFLRDPSTVHRVYLRYTFQDRTITTSNFEYKRYLDLNQWTTSFSEHAAFFLETAAVGSGAASRERSVGAVSASFFDFFDARPAAGRFFIASEDATPRGADVAVLSYAFWQSEYGGQDVIGQPIQIGGVRCTIIGIAPKGFAGVSDDDPPVAYFPITTFAGSQPDDDGREYFLNYNWGWMEMMVRRKPGIGLAAATTDLTNAFVRSWNAARATQTDQPPADLAHPAAIPGALKTAAGPDPSLDARTLLWVTGVAVAVLLIACANITNLFLARALRRRKEVALRTALGVSRGRLLAQSLTESTVLALLGCGVGVVIAQWGGVALRRLFLGESATFDLFRDVRTLGAALAAALAAGILTGLAPVLLARPDDLAATLKSGARDGTHRRSRTREALLVLQGTMSVVLLVGAGLFVRSLSKVRDFRLGFDPEPVLIATRNFRGMEASDSDRVRLARRMLSEAQRIPGVEHAALVSSIPFWSTSTTGLFVTGVDSVQRLGRFSYQTASPDFFKVMGTRILRGRPFDETDIAGGPRVAVVSEGMARVLWPKQDAIGACIRVRADTMPCTTVIGIAEDAVQTDLLAQNKFHYYLPSEQFRPERAGAVVLRMRGDPAQTGDGVRRALQTLMPGEAYVTVRPMRDLIGDQRRSWRLGAAMFIAFGGLALVVAAVGLYAVMGYDVTQRTHEMGVRIALGAQPGDLVRFVVGQGVRFALLGIGLGSALALFGARWIEPLLFQQSATDPTVFVGVAMLLVAVALLASSIPARRATQADPNRALRTD